MHEYDRIKAEVKRYTKISTFRMMEIVDVGDACAVRALTRDGTCLQFLWDKVNGLVAAKFETWPPEP